MARTISQNEQQARALFGGTTNMSAEQLLQLARNLRDSDNNLESSRRVLRIALDRLDGASPTVGFKVRRDLMICTYKTPDRAVDDRLKEAEVLGQTLLNDASLTAEQRQDVLGVMGAIWKARWSTYGHREHLERSLSYYRRGMDIGSSLDGGYTSVNAAFVLELLAGTVADPAAKLAMQSEAKIIREQVRDVLVRQANADPKKVEDFWFLATLGEVYLGIRNFDEAEHWMELAGKRQPPPWQIEATVRQAAKLASLMPPN